MMIGSPGPGPERIFGDADVGVEPGIVQPARAAPGGLLGRIDRTPAAVLLAILLLGAAFLFYSPPRDAAELDVVPDSMELAIGGRRIAAGHGYTIVVDGREMPPRYPPWFSLVFEAPVFLVASDVGYGILPVTAMALVAIALAFHLGSAAAGAWGGSAAAVALASLPLLRRTAADVLTDVPCVALVLALMAIHVHLRRSDRREHAMFLLAGALGTLAFLMRPVSGAALLPLAVQALARPGWRRRAGSAAALALPFVLGVLAQLGWNARTFGDPLRSGFQHWCPVPYDYPDLVRSADYVAANASLIWDSKLPLLALGCAALAVATARAPAVRSEAGASARGLRVRSIVAMAEFAILASLPMLAFHLQYYSFRPRYLLPVFAVLLVLSGSLAGAWLERLRRRALVLALLVALAGTAVWKAGVPDRIPRRQDAVRSILAHTPEDAIVVSAIAPAYLEELANPRGTRTIVPLSRGVEYAARIVARTRVERPEPPPRNARDGRCPGLLAGGAEEAVHAVAIERIDELRAAIASGRRVFLDLTDVARSGTPEAADELARSFRVEPVEGRLSELK